MVGTSLDVQDNPERLKRATALVGTVVSSQRQAEKQMADISTWNETAPIDGKAFMTCMDPVTKWSKQYAQQLASPLKEAFFQSVFMHKQFPDRRNC